MVKVIRDWLHRYFSDEQAVVLAVLLVLGFAVVLTLGGMLAPVLTGLVLAFLMQGLVNGLNVYDEPYYQVDLNAVYSFTPALSISASVLNLTEEETRSHLGNDTKDRFYTNGYAGRMASLGLTYKF